MRARLVVIAIPMDRLSRTRLTWFVFERLTIVKTEPVTMEGIAVVRAIRIGGADGK